MWRRSLADAVPCPLRTREYAGEWGPIPIAGTVPVSVLVVVEEKVGDRGRVTLDDVVSVGVGQLGYREGQGGRESRHGHESVVRAHRALCVLLSAKDGGPGFVVAV